MIFYPHFDFGFWIEEYFLIFLYQENGFKLPNCLSKMKAENLINLRL